MRVLAWVPQEVDTSPGQRYRIEQWDPYLRQEGIEITYSPFATAELTEILQRPGRLHPKAWGVTRALVRRLREARTVTGFDLVYVFREGALLGPAIAERMLATSGVPFVFDFDDAVWVRYVSPANSYLSYFRCAGKTATLCRLAQRVIVGNDHLYSYAARYNRNVTVVPTTVDTAKYQLAPTPTGSPPIIGWTGSYSTEQYLGLIRPALQRLRRRRDFKIVVVGGRTFTAPGIAVEHRALNPASEVTDISDFTIGLMPLLDTSWERGKCGLKALQYMALGIPAVVSPVGVNAQIIRHGENGFLATTEDEWVEVLDQLLADPQLRQQTGLAGRRTVVKRFSAEIHAPRVAQIFRAAVS
jgi:glycosyltransferase involved in cell wall biosynthesis